MGSSRVVLPAPTKPDQRVTGRCLSRLVNSSCWQLASGVQDVPEVAQRFVLMPSCVCFTLTSLALSIFRALSRSHFTFLHLCAPKHCPLFRHE